MSALKALPRNDWRAEHLDPAALDQLAAGLLENLASLAHDRGLGRQADRLRDAAQLLRHEPEAITSRELSQREWEVAQRVVRGCSNRQIAFELMVSERTVDTHVSHILRKLLLSSRAQIAAWVVERQPRFRVLM